MTVPEGETPDRPNPREASEDSAQPMTVLRVFNNNVVLAHRSTGPDVVVTGRGVGFGTKPGAPVDLDRIARVFVPEYRGNAETLGQKVAAVSPEHIELLDHVMARVQRPSDPAIHATTVVALADHLGFALERLSRGLELEYPLRAEVAHLYPEEFTQAQHMVELLNERLEQDLPDAEAVPLTLHLVNGGFTTGDLADTYRMTTVIPQMFRVLEGVYGRPFDRDGIGAARFIAHLRYFFVRVHTGHQFPVAPSALGGAIRESYPQAHQAAGKLRTLLEIKLEHPVSEEEVTYLTLHVARMAGEATR